MRVFIATSCGLPFPPVLGSALGQLWLHLVNENEKTDNEFCLTTSYNKEAVNESKKFQKTKVIFYKHNVCLKFLDYICNFILFRGKKVNPLWKIIVIRKTRKEILNNEYDAIVFQNSGFLLSCIDDTISKKYAGKLYYHLHNDVPSNVNIDKLKQCKCILISKFLSEKVLALSPFQQYSILHNSIDVTLFSNRASAKDLQKLKEKLNIPLQNKVLVFVGRIVEYKGIEKLIDAFYSIKGAYTLLIIGSSEFGLKTNTSFEKRIKQKVERDKRIVFTGFIHNSELPKYYQLGDIAVLPSLWKEPAGLTIIEAAACGIPVITTKKGGIPEYLGSEGIYVDVDDRIIDSLREAILLVINNYDDYCKKAIRIQNRIISNYSASTYYKRFMEIVDGD